MTQALFFVTIIAALLSFLMMIFPDDTAYLLGASEHLRPMVTDYLVCTIVDISNLDCCFFVYYPS